MSHAINLPLPEYGRAVERLGLPAAWSALTVGQARRLIALAQNL